MKEPRIDFSEHRLENGLRVVLSKDELAPIAAVNIWYNVGSRHESPGRTGLAHLFEHMMFEGSRNVGKAEHFRFISQAGGSLNGTTWVDRTNYFETVPSHHLELVLWLEADRMGGLLDAIDQEKLDNQRAVVKNERRQSYDNRPYGTWSERLQAAVFPPGHPYHHSTIGSMDDLDAASLDDVKDFFRLWYAPNNAVLSIAGDFDPAQTMEWVRRYFGPIPSNPAVGHPPPPPIQPLIGEGRREVVADRVPLTRIFLGYRTPPYGSAEQAALAVGGAVLSEGRGSRLHSRLVREGRLAQEASFGMFDWAGGASMALGWATALPDADPAAVERAFLETVEGLGTEDLPGDEIERARAQIEREELRALMRADERADRLSMHATLFGDPGRANDRIPALLAVTPEQVRAAAAKFLFPANRAVIVFEPQAGEEAAA